MKEYEIDRENFQGELEEWEKVRGRRGLGALKREKKGGVSTDTREEKENKANSEEDRRR